MRIPDGRPVLAWIAFGRSKRLRRRRVPKVSADVDDRDICRCSRIVGRRSCGVVGLTHDPMPASASGGRCPAEQARLSRRRGTTQRHRLGIGIGIAAPGQPGLFGHEADDMYRLQAWPELTASRLEVSTTNGGVR